MMFSIVTMLAIFLLAMAPGWLVILGRPMRVGMMAASIVCSIATTLLLTAVLGVAAGFIGSTVPATAIIPVSAAAALAVIVVRRNDPNFIEFARNAMTRVEWQGVAVGLVLVVWGLAAIASAFSETANGDLLVHSWYNADWFKHMGHVHALANFGLPARDIFGGGGPLHYYWLFYTLPGAATALGADPWVALSSVNAAISLLLGYLFYSIVRMVIRSRNGALALTLTAFVVLAPAGFFFWFLGQGTLAQFFASGISPNGSGLLATSQVIPQHALATAVIGSWIVLSQPTDKPASAVVRFLPFAPLAALMAISTLLGAIFLMAYGFIRLALDRLKAIPELTLMAVASVAIVALLGVLKISDPGSAIDSPLLTDAVDPRPTWALAIAGLSKSVSLVGFGMLAIVPFLLKLRPKDARESYAMTVSFCLVIAGVVAVLASQVLLPERPAAEIFGRAKIPFSIATMLLGSMIVARFWNEGARNRRIVVGVLAVFAVLSTPTIYATARWQGNFGDSFTTTIPQQDRKILSSLRGLSASDAIIWQYPEKPFLGRPSGRDNWSAIFAGRTVPNSERATDYGQSRPGIERSERWFAEEVVALPKIVDWVYLSRALHPESYDSLVARMDGDAAFDRRECYVDACLFQRRESRSQ